MYSIFTPVTVWNHHAEYPQNNPRLSLYIIITWVEFPIVRIFSWPDPDLAGFQVLFVWSYFLLFFRFFLCRLKRCVRDISSLQSLFVCNLFSRAVFNVSWNWSVFIYIHNFKVVLSKLFGEQLRIIMPIRFN